MANERVLFVAVRECFDCTAFATLFPNSRFIRLPTSSIAATPPNAETYRSMISLTVGKSVASFSVAAFSEPLEAPAAVASIDEGVLCPLWHE